MFTVKKHDFGRVAIGSDSVFRFPVKNIYAEDVKLVGVHSSCGCTDPSLTKKILKTGETGEVVARLNTSGQHVRDKSATLTVDLETVLKGKVERESVQLSVAGYIRPDVVLTPGIVEFGSVPEGRSVVRNQLLEYAGRNDWALTKIERSNPFVHARAEEVKRSGGEVSYNITVTLKPNAPVGYVKDALRFVTNERSTETGQLTEIVLPIQGMVTAPVHANPSPLMVGIISSGQTVAKNIIVRGSVPFKIQDVTSDDKRFRFTFANQENSIQIVSILFSAKRTNVTATTNIVGKIKDGGGVLVCCGEPMKEIIANTVDAAVEKHIPVYEQKGEAVNVTVGSVEHPMLEEHYIEWIMVYQDGQTQRVQLDPKCFPKAEFRVNPTRPFQIFAHCNIHGLWKADS